MTSIDRAPLANDLEKHKNVTHIICDGATWLPSSKVDWVFCDISYTPSTYLPSLMLKEHMAIPAPKSAEVLKRWVDGEWCHYFAWTIKFVGNNDYSPVISRIRIILQDFPFVIRHLPLYPICLPYLVPRLCFDTLYSRK